MKRETKTSEMVFGTKQANIKRDDHVKNNVRIVIQPIRKRFRFEKSQRSVTLILKKQLINR